MRQCVWFFTFASFLLNFKNIGCQNGILYEKCLEYHFIEYQTLWTLDNEFRIFVAISKIFGSKSRNLKRMIAYQFLILKQTV